jgi:CubicO group peptidase (beta-lactamase class C family)
MASIRRGSTAGLLLIALLPSLPTPLHAATPERYDDLPRALDRYIAATLREWDLPGAALAVVKDGRVVVAKGYGVRELGKPERVDENTLFDVASLTKAFTAAAVGCLVDEGKMRWDAPVRAYLPSIEFPDPYLTANVTVRDLLCHRAGIRATNRAWYLTRLARPRLLELVRHMEIAAPFRTRVAYWNIGYAIAGEAAAAAAGTTWEELVTDSLLVPLGMTRTTTDFDRVPALGNHASGHDLIDGTHRVTPRETARRSTAPAGVIHASAADLATWMLFQLGDGSHRGRRILNEATLEEMHSPQIAVPSNARFRASRQIHLLTAYGLGWQIFDYRGHRLAWHSGNGDGQIAFLQLLPDDGLGIAVLVNSWKAGAALNGAIASRITDHYLGLSSRDHVAEFRDWWTKSEARRADAERALESVRRSDTKPSLPLAACAGRYEDPLGLEVEVWVEADTLRLRYGGGETATLSHWHHDTYRARWENPLHAKILSMFVSFDIDPRGEVDRLHMDPYGEDVDARRKEP